MKRRALALLLAIVLAVPAGSGLAVQAEETTVSTEKATETVVQSAQKEKLEKAMKWDFETSEQLNDFSTSATGASVFGIADGTLHSNGTNGVMRATINADLSELALKEVSVDILPNEQNGFKGALQVGTAVFAINSSFTGWTDAPNRVDLVVSKSSGEIERTITESGKKNNLYSGGTKVPLNLTVTLSEDLVAVTMSVRDDASKYIQKIYEIDSTEFAGNISVTADNTYICYDNLTLTYEQPGTENLVTGLSFAGTGLDSYAKTDAGVTEKPKTIEAWIKTNATGKDQPIITNFTEGTIADNVSGTWGLYLNTQGNLWWVDRTADTSDVNQNDTEIACNTGEWTHVAVVRSDKVYFYVNGQLASAKEDDQLLTYETSVNNPITIGYSSTWDFAFNGEIGDIRLWSTARTQEQIQSTMEVELAGTEDGLTHYWNLDEQSGTVFEDKAGNVNGTLEGATWSFGNANNVVKYINEGYQFADGNTWMVQNSVDTAPLTLEAWVKIPKGIVDAKTAMIISNSTNVPTISMEMYTNGRPRLYWKVKESQNPVDVIVPADLRTGEWTHVAFTCDMTNDTVICYINGVAVYTLPQAGLSGMVMPPSIIPEHHYYIGNISTGADANRFLGWIADARMWNRPLSQAEVSQSMMTQYTSQKDGLLFNAPLNEKTENVFKDLSDKKNDVVLYKRQLNWTEDTAAKGEYSIVVIPDQQILTNFYEEKLYSMYQWIADNAEAENVQMVMNLGDIVDKCVETRVGQTDMEVEWKKAKNAFEILPDNLPFMAVPGNHDYDRNWNWGTGTSDRYNDLDYMNKYFPLSIFQNYDTESGSFSEDRGETDNVANIWQAFEVNGNKYMILALECNPRDDALEWANEVVASHPDYQVIVMTHNNLEPSGHLSYAGENIWEKFTSKHSNIIMTLCGHQSNDNIVRRFDTGVNGNTVVQMLLDGQTMDAQKTTCGMLGILRFNADGTECNLSWFSPNITAEEGTTAKTCLNADINQFTIELPSQAAGNPVALETETWDFESAEQLDDFDLYASGTDSFSVQDGKLVPSGTNGEMKAILKGDISDIKQVSVDIIPGESGTINAGLYLGASDAGNAAGAIDALAFLVESNFSGWSDAPNRIDIITGTFPKWSEKQRIISQSGSGNAIYSGGTKGPLNLCLDFGEGMVTVTVSLVGNANKFVQTVYECNPEDLVGSIGIRANNDDMCFDNFSIGYDREIPAKLQQGIKFSGENKASAKLSSAVGKIPQTVEMWVKVNQDTAASRSALISSFTGTSVAASQVGDWALFTNENGALWWFEKTAKGAVSHATGITIKTGEWTHVAITRETGNVNYYVNGTLVGTLASANVVLDTASSTVPTLGFCSYDSNGANPNYLDGAIGDVRLWSTTRTQKQIKEDMFVEATGSENGLMNHWGLDEQTGTVFKDSTTAGNNGTITDDATWVSKIDVGTGGLGNVTYQNKGYNFSLNKVWITEKGQHVYPNHTVEAWVKIPEAVKTENVIAYNDMLTRFQFSITAGGSPQLYWKDEADKETKIIASNVDVRTSKWTHVAFVSDAAAQTVTCYVNGKSVHVAENVVLNAISENEFVTRKVSLGNKFVGLMADFRLWTKPLSAAEVKNSMSTAYTQAVDGLVLNVPFDDATTTEFRDLSGKDNTIVVYERRVEWTDDTSEPKDYSMVVIPDQQALSSRYPAVLDRIYQWIADNAKEENIKFAMNLGDITDYNTQEEWEYSLAALDKIDDLMPYSFVPGNHEYFIPERGKYSYAGYGYRNLTEMNKYFGNIYDKSPAYGGTYDGGVENTWHEFEVNGHKYLILALEYYPRDSVLAWASEIVEAHPYHQVIVTTHSYVNTDGIRVATASDGFLYEDGKEGPNTGQQMWEEFASQHENIIMVLCGHIISDPIVPRIDEGVHGNKVIQMLINGQGLDGTYRGVGLLAMLRFNEAGDEMELTYFSPGHGENGEDQIFNDTTYTFKLPTPVDMDTNKFTGMTLNLDGKIGFNFYVDKEHTLSEEAYVEFELPKGGTQRVALKDAVETSNGLKFTCLIPAKEMADKITATLYDGGGKIDVQTISVKDYAEIIVKNEKHYASYIKATPLMKSMLHYGAYSQKLFTYNTKELANANYVSEDKVQSVTVNDLQGYAKGAQGLNGFGRLAGATLILEGETTLRMFFEFEKGAELDGLKFTVNGIDKSYIASGNYYIVECENIAAKDLDLEYKVAVITDKGTQFTVTSSVMTFCHSALNSASTSAALKNVAKALYLYNVEANKYMEGEAVSISEYYTAKTGTVYADSNHGFSVQDGKLVPPASVGEGKVMVNKSAAESYQSLSADIYPGEANIINGGFYLGASEANITEDSIHALTVMAESFMSDPNRVDITIGTFTPWHELARFEFKSDHEDVLFTDGVKEPLNLKVDIASNVVDNVTTYTITATLTLLSDTSKTATATYVYTGDYDLVNGQIGLRSQYDDSSFDNFVVQSSKGTTTYTFDNDVTTSEYGFTYYHSTWRGGVKATADNTLAFHDTQSFTEGILTAEVNTHGSKEAGIVFGADETLTNYYLYRLTTNNTAELVKVVDGVETVLHTEALPAGHDNTVYNTLEIIKVGNRIYCYYNGSSNIKCYAFYEDEAMLSGTGIGIWAETADTDYKNVTYKDM